MAEAAANSDSAEQGAKRRDTKEVDAALEAWARWAKSALSGVGWSKICILWRIIQFGALGAARQFRGGEPLEVDTLCELVDQALLRLSKDEQAVVVRQYWYSEPLSVTAKECHMSYDRCRKLWASGRRSVGDYLEGAKMKQE